LLFSAKRIQFLPNILLGGHMGLWIAAATLLGSAYQADTARRSAKDARLVAEREAAAAERATQAQIEQQQQQTAIASERLKMETARYSEQKSTMEKEAQRIASELDAERRRTGAEESGKMKARVRGGKRALLSDERLAPELGLLGSGMGY
jgi:hypothetical protein